MTSRSNDICDFPFICRFYVDVVLSWVKYWFAYLHTNFSVLVLGFLSNYNQTRWPITISNFVLSGQLKDSTYLVSMMTYNPIDGGQSIVDVVKLFKKKYLLPISN